MYYELQPTYASFANRDCVAHGLIFLHCCILIYIVYLGPTAYNRYHSKTLHDIQSIVFGIWWKCKIALMGIVQKSCPLCRKPCAILFSSRRFIFVENCINVTCIGMPPRILPYRHMYIAPSSGHTSFYCNMPFKLDSKEMWGCFLTVCSD